MDEAQFLGYLVTAVITLGAFMLVIQRLTQPINDLKVVIQELRDCINALRNDSITQNKRLDEHSKAIDDLNMRLGKAEAKIDLYHR